LPLLLAALAAVPEARRRLALANTPEAGEGAMTEIHTAASCRWAVPTLFLARPFWFDAADRPWTCLRDGEPHELDSTDICRTCPRWEPRGSTPVDVGERWNQLQSHPYFLDVFSTAT
jgi:hypothetical protein